MSESFTPCKIKHIDITLATKAEIVYNILNEVKTVDNMSIEYEVGKSTIYGCLEKKVDLLIYFDGSYHNSIKKRERKPKYPELEKLLYN